jgi:hypothetical protein
MLTLREITHEQRLLLEQINENEGELTPVMEEALTINQENLQAKTESYVVVINKLEDYGESLDKEIKRLTAKKKAIEHSLSFLKSNLKMAIQLFGPVQTPFNKISLRKTVQMVIKDTDQVPGEFATIKTEIQIDKTALKKAIESGAIKPSIHYFIKEEFHLQIK